MNKYLYLAHHGILGQKWGVRRYQNEDGSLTPAGLKRYSIGSTVKKDTSFNVSGKAAKPSLVKYEESSHLSYDSNGKLKSGTSFLRTKAGRYKTFGNKTSSVYTNTIFDKTGDYNSLRKFDHRLVNVTDGKNNWQEIHITEDKKDPRTTLTWGVTDARNTVERLFNTLNADTLREANRTYIDSAQVKGEKRDSYAGAYKTDLEIDKLRELDKLNETDSATLLTQIHEAVLSKKIESDIEFAYEYGTNYDTETALGKDLLNALTVADRVIDTIKDIAIDVKDTVIDAKDAVVGYVKKKKYGEPKWL